MKTIAIRICLVVGTAAALAGCAAGQATNAVAPIATRVTTGVDTAENVYGIAKGIALAAEVADPSLRPLVDKTVAIVDPYAAALAAGTPVLAGIAINAAGLVDQAAALEASTAQVIKVVPAH